MTATAPDAKKLEEAMGAEYADALGVDPEEIKAAYPLAFEVEDKASPMVLLTRAQLLMSGAIELVVRAARQFENETESDKWAEVEVKMREVSYAVLRLKHAWTKTPIGAEIVRRLKAAKEGQSGQSGK